MFAHKWPYHLPKISKENELAGNIHKFYDSDKKNRCIFIQWEAENFIKIMLPVNYSSLIHNNHIQMEFAVSANLLKKFIQNMLQTTNISCFTQRFLAIQIEQSSFEQKIIWTFCHKIQIN